MEMYHFVTTWFFQAPIGKIWDELMNMSSWPSWWPSWKKAAFRGTEPSVQLGSLIDNEVRGSLPYSLRFTLEVDTLQPPRLWQFKSSGGLVGTGKFELETKDDGAQVTYHWDVGTSNPVFSLFAKLPFVKKVMEKNHNQIMDEFYCGLKQRLE